eukprot:EG_transcript_50737
MEFLLDQLREVLSPDLVAEVLPSGLPHPTAAPIAPVAGFPTPAPAPSLAPPVPPPGPFAPYWPPPAYPPYSGLPSPLDAVQRPPQPFQAGGGQPWLPQATTPQCVPPPVAAVPPHPGTTKAP